MFYVVNVTLVFPETPNLCSLAGRGCPGFMEESFGAPQHWYELFDSHMKHPGGFSWQGACSWLEEHSWGHAAEDPGGDAGRCEPSARHPV